MAQASVTDYFNTRKRPAVDEIKLNRTKVLLLEKPENGDKTKSEDAIEVVYLNSDKKSLVGPTKLPKLEESKKNDSLSTKSKRKQVGNQGNLEQFLKNMAPKIVEEIHVTPPSSPRKNAMDNVNLASKDLNLSEIKAKLLRSNKLAELKASLNRFKQSAAKLKKIEEKTSKIETSPSLKSFKSLEIEVRSPQKPQTPEKAYLSPAKNKSVKQLFSPVKKDLFETQSSSVEVGHVKKGLTLPYKYRSLAETFRSIDTVCQILFKRKEIITFNKLKPAVEELQKKNLTESHLAKIKKLFPDAFQFKQEKYRVFGAGVRKEEWGLVITPNIGQETMTSEILLERRRKFFRVLLEKVKDYHQEFLLSLTPPMVISRNKITRWHPEFNIEGVPDIELAELPASPVEIKLKTGQEVLEKARELFNCNTRMESALERLKQARANNLVVEQSKEVPSLLKGIPKGLLEKVRERQAAKAFQSITRSSSKDKVIAIYSKLPEIARVCGNIFVSEKKSVLPLKTVLEKLENSYRVHLTEVEMEEHLRIISKEAPGWLEFVEIRYNKFLKVARNVNFNLVISKLEEAVKSKVDS